MARKTANGGLDPNPESTWGATEDYISRWHQAYGDDESKKFLENVTIPTVPAQGQSDYGSDEAK